MKRSTITISSWLLRLGRTFAALAITLLMAPEWARAAACCGGSFAAPGLISGDDQTQVTTSLSSARQNLSVDSRGYWHQNSDPTVSETFRLDVAQLISDRWQVGAVLPVVRRTARGDSSTGVSDVSASLGYEILTDWDYSSWRPKGILYVQVTAPTGKSVSESRDANQLDVTGRGFWATGMGILLTKSRGRWDVFGQGDVHRSFAKSVSNEDWEGTLEPGWGGSAGGGVGLNWNRWRLGGALIWNYEDPIRIHRSTGQNSDGALERYATLSASISAMIGDEWSGTLSYSDQSRFGSPFNTTLSQTVMLQIQRRWPR